MDYWAGVEGTVVFDSVYKSRTGGSTEGDGGTDYYSVYSGFEFTYGNTSYLKDTEKGIEYYQTALLIPVLKYFRLGLDYMDD